MPASNWKARAIEAAAGTVTGAGLAGLAAHQIYEPKKGSTWRLNPTDGSLERRDLSDEERRDRWKSIAKWAKRAALPGAAASVGGGKVMRVIADRGEKAFLESKSFRDITRSRQNIIGTLTSHQQRRIADQMGKGGPMATLGEFANAIAKKLRNPRQGTLSSSDEDALSDEGIERLRVLQQMLKDEPIRLRAHAAETAAYRDAHAWGMVPIQINPNAKPGDPNRYRPDPRGSLVERIGTEAKQSGSEDLPNFYSKMADEITKRNLAARVVKNENT